MPRQDNSSVERKVRHAIRHSAETDIFSLRQPRPAGVMKEVEKNRVLRRMEIQRRREGKFKKFR